MTITTLISYTVSPPKYNRGKPNFETSRCRKAVYMNGSLGKA